MGGTVRLYSARTLVDDKDFKLDHEMKARVVRLDTARMSSLATPTALVLV